MNGKPFLSLMLASGGDNRIVVPKGQNTNRYGASPYPRATLGYASSTANDISLAAFAHLDSCVSVWPAGSLSDPAYYASELESQRTRIRKAWGISQSTNIVFAPSGTDLELAALALAAAKSGQPVTNVLLGQDEVGSGCVLAAAGKYFAKETAVERYVEPGMPLEGLGDTNLVILPIRGDDGVAIESSAITSKLLSVGEGCSASGHHLLLHVVHGSKTGLILPNMADIDMLQRRLGKALTIVVDACQVRIEPSIIEAYLQRGAMVMLSGSKFMGGPPFSGFLLVPENLTPKRKLAQGLSNVFRRAEWPYYWSGVEHLPDSTNPGLLLRIEAALFELERYLAVPIRDRTRVVASFGAAVQMLANRLNAKLIWPALASTDLHEGTLATLDLASCPGQPNLSTAQRWCRVLAARGLRLGQPVKCRNLNNGEWAGTLRISLSMPLIVELSALASDKLSLRFESDMARIADVLEAAFRPVVA